MKHFQIITVILTAFWLLYCSSVPYSGMEIIPETEGYNYYIGNDGSDSLIIYIDGSGYQSVLGLHGSNGQWAETTLSNPLSQQFRNTYNILIPEKLNFSPGEMYTDNPMVLSKSTVQDLGLSYANKIDSFLSNHTYDEIIIIGASEGGALLPFIYNNLESINKIAKLVIWSGGGLNQLKERQI